MDECMRNVMKNCNGCIFKQIESRHWELDDYCILNNKCISGMDMEEDCPLMGEGEDYVQSTALQ